MAENVDDSFYARADAHINLSNEQLRDIGIGKVSASMMYSVARFNAWVSACGFESANDMSAARNETIDYFVKQYSEMLKDNLDDYVANFEKYMGSKP